MNHDAPSHRRPPSSPKKSPLFPGGGQTFFGKFQRVKIEGRRGRSYWEWKSAESKKERCGHEGDDEMTSLESDTLARRVPPVGRSKEDALCHPKTCGIKVLPPFSSPQSARHKGHVVTEENNDTIETTVVDSLNQKPLKSILSKVNVKKEHQLYPSTRNSHPSAPPKELVCADASPGQDEKSKFILGHGNNLVDRSSHTKYISERDNKPNTNQYRSAFDPENNRDVEKGNKLGDKGLCTTSVQEIKDEHNIRNETGKGSDCFVSKKDTFSKEDNYLKCLDNKPIYPIISKNAENKHFEYEPEEKQQLHESRNKETHDNYYKQTVTQPVKKSASAASRVQIHSQSSSSVSAGNKRNTSVNDKKQSRKSGALVWVNQPGGGAKLEWIPTAGLSTIRTVPSNKPVEAKIAQSGSSELEGSNSVADSKESTLNSSTKTSITRDDQGHHTGGHGKGRDERMEEARAEKPNVTRVASSALSAGCDGSGGNCEPNEYLSDRQTDRRERKVDFADCEVTTLGNAQSPKYTRQKNAYSSVPGEAGLAGRTNPLTGILSGGNFRNSDRDSPSSGGEDRIVSVAGRNQGQVVRIRVRPEVHAYLSNLPVINSAFHYRQHDNRRDSFQSGNSSVSGITWGSGEGSVGYKEEDYSAVVDEYTLLRRAVDEQDPEALRLLTETESAISSGKKSSNEENESFASKLVSYPCMEKTM